MSNTVNVIHIKASPEEAAENLLDTLKGELQRKGDVLCNAWTELHTLLSQPGVVTVEDPSVLSTLQDKGTLLSSTWNELYNLIAAYQTELSSRESQVVTAWAQIQSKEQLAGELRKKNATLEEELRKKSESMSTTQATITALLSQQKKFDNVSGEKQAIINKYQSDLEDRETVLSNMTLENMALTAKVEELESHVQNIDPNHVEREETLEKYKSEMLSLTEENSLLAEKLKKATKVSEPVEKITEVKQPNGVKFTRTGNVVMPKVTPTEKKKAVPIIVSKAKESNGGQGDAKVVIEQSTHSNTKSEDTETPIRKTRSAAIDTDTPTTPASTPTNKPETPVVPTRSSGRRRKAEIISKIDETSTGVPEETSPLRSKRGRLIKAKGTNQTWTDYYARSGLSSSRDVKNEPSASRDMSDTHPEGHMEVDLKDSGKGTTETLGLREENTAIDTASASRENDDLFKNSLDDDADVTIGESQIIVDQDMQPKILEGDAEQAMGNNCTICNCKFTSRRYLRIHMKQTHPSEGEPEDNVLLVKHNTRKNCEGELAKIEIFGTSDGKTNVKQSGNRVEKVDQKLKIEYQCEECELSFPRSLLLSKHVKVSHPGDRPHRCGYCGKRFALKEQLKTHHVMHNTERPHHCDHCDARFAKKSQLVRHARSHTGERPFICEVCAKTFTEAYLLTVHKRCHNNIKSYICETCGAAFRNNSDMSRHMRSHTGERRHHCDDCGKDFRRLEHLRLHLRTHTGEKPYQCEVCSRGFAQLGDLKKHSRTHTGVRPYSCECGKSFSTKGSYERHLDTHRRDLLKTESTDISVSKILPLDALVKEETLTENVELPAENVENLVIDESQIQNISIHNSIDIQNILSTIAQTDSENQPLTLIQTNTGGDSHFSLRVVGKNVQIVPVSEVTDQESAHGNVVQLETGSLAQEISAQGVDYENMLLQLQDAVTTASSLEATGGEVVHVLLQNQPVE